MTDPAWNDIVKQLGPALLRYFSASFPTAIASDLVQEVLIRLVRKHRSGHFVEAKGTLRMFAFGIAHYVRLEGLKATPVETHFADTTDYDGRSFQVSAEPENAEKIFRLRQALLSLSETERQIILLHIDEEMTLAHISEILKIPVGTVKSHVHRAKEKLKKRLMPDKGVQNG